MMCKLNELFENGRGLSAARSKPNQPIRLLRRPDDDYRPDLCPAVMREMFRLNWDLMTALAIKSAPKITDRLRLALPLLQEAGLPVLQKSRIGLGKLLAALVGAVPETVFHELAKVKA
jgi:hypothetical protein